MRLAISDQKKAKELWDERYEQWFPQGPSDPSLILIQVTVEQAEYWNASSTASPLDVGFVVLAPERRHNPEFHSKIAMLSEYGPVMTTNSPCASCGMFHPTIYHRAFPNLYGQGETRRDAAENLIRRLTNEKDIHAGTWPGESVEQAIAEIRLSIEKSS